MPGSGVFIMECPPQSGIFECPELADSVPDATTSQGETEKED
jgi:hypothetical protein